MFCELFCDGRFVNGLSIFYRQNKAVSSDVDITILQGRGGLRMYSTSTTILRTEYCGLFTTFW